MSVVFDAKTGRLRDNGAAEQAETPAEKPRGHGRGKDVIDPRRGGDAALRGIPLIGVGAGAIAGTSPGGEIGAAARLERDVREARELNNRARRVVRDRISASGILRTRRETI